MNWIPRIGPGPPPANDGPTIELRPVQVHNVETAPERRPRTLKHLLRANHANYSIIYHNLLFHNHMPHILCSAYLLGASHTQLHRIYEAEAKELESWTDSPLEITLDDWTDFLGNGNYQRAYVDFFEDQLVMRFRYHDWRDAVSEFVFGGQMPLVYGLIGGRESTHTHTHTHTYRTNSQNEQPERTKPFSMLHSTFPASTLCLEANS